MHIPNKYFLIALYFQMLYLDKVVFVKRIIKGEFPTRSTGTDEAINLLVSNN